MLKRVLGISEELQQRVKEHVKKELKGVREELRDIRMEMRVS